jgi:hypothetical protein
MEIKNVKDLADFLNQLVASGYGDLPIHFKPNGERWRALVPQVVKAVFNNVPMQHVELSEKSIWDK